LNIFIKSKRSMRFIHIYLSWPVNKRVPKLAA